MLIAVVNESTIVTSTPLQRAVDAVAHQLRYQAGPAWGRHAVPVVAYPDEKSAPVGSQLVIVLDDADQAGALGYHDETPHGSPYARVFARTSERAGVEWSSVLSHEILELFVDPSCQLWADDGHGTLYAVELCDPVEGDAYTITARDGTKVAVSNFVTPAWFDPQGVGRFDWLGRTSSPFTMSKGGYVIVMVGGKVSQRFDAEVDHDLLAATKSSPASRTSKRLTQQLS